MKKIAKKTNIQYIFICIFIVAYCPPQTKENTASGPSL